VPTKAGHYSNYKLIALFNSGLAYLANGSQEWRLFSLASWGVDYSDAIEHNGFIVAVDGWTGTTYCWDQSQAGNSSIHMIYFAINFNIKPIHDML
jgi:hypothetical protein